MLIVTRSPTESIIINDNIKIAVIGVRGIQVKIGIDAPKEIPVDREELRAQKNASKALKNQSNENCP